MGYVKSMLPEDWEPPELGRFLGNKIKYLCIGSEQVEAEWLSRWYKVPEDECVYRKYSKLFGGVNKNEYANCNLIELIPLPEGSDYDQKFKELKTEKLLNGNDVR